MILVRVRHVQPNGIGYMTESGTCTSDIRDAHIYGNMSEAWNHMGLSGNMGSDETGEWCWPEEITDEEYVERLKYIPYR